MITALYVEHLPRQAHPRWVVIERTSTGFTHHRFHSEADALSFATTTVITHEGTPS